ncbi:MAG: hypothetical protein Q8K92_26620 [Leadbetterella sp.]|nr:hypothetical protein [Leadbetterella sp.]
MVEKINPLLANTKATIEMLHDSNYTLHLIDADPYDRSAFFVKVSLPKPNGTYDVSLQPANKNTTLATQYAELKTEGVYDVIKGWIDVLESYTVPSVFDNPARHHAEYFYDAMRNDDPAADSVPYNVPSLLILDNNLHHAEQVLTTLQDESEDTKLPELQNLLQDISYLRSQMQVMSQNAVKHYLARIMGKTMSLGLRYYRAVLAKFRENMIDKIVDGLIDGAVDLLT